MIQFFIGLFVGIAVTVCAVCIAKLLTRPQKVRREKPSFPSAAPRSKCLTAGRRPDPGGSVVDEKRRYNQLLFVDIGDPILQPWEKEALKRLPKQPASDSTDEHLKS